MNTEQQFDDAPVPSLTQYLAVAVRNRWWIILLACITWAAALAATVVLPAKYKSETVILIDQPRVSSEYVTPSVAVDLQDRLQSLTEQVESRTRLVRIIDSLHLYGKKANQDASDEMVQRMRNDITIDLVKSPGRSGDISAFKITYSAPSPAIAQEVTSQLTSEFIGEEMRNQQELAQGTTDFLDSQLTEARRDLEEQEKVLGRFRGQYVGELPEQLGSNVQILSGLQGRLQSATDALHQAEQQRLYLVSLLGQSKTSQTSNTETASSTPTLDQQLDRMKSDLAEKMTRYTPEHPDIIRLKEQIANAEKLKRQVQEDVKAGRRNPDMPVPGQSASISPTAQLESQLKANELEIEHRKDEVKTLEGQIAQYEGRLNLTPVREQQLAALDRNHKQSQTNYESLLAKKLQSEMATNLEKKQQGRQFRMIDPPSLPQHPYWPNRLAFALGGLAGGTFLGVAACVVIQVLSPCLYGEKQLTDMDVEAPVLIIIPPLPTAHERRVQARRLGWEVAAGVVVSLIVPALTLFVHLRG